MEKIKSVEQLPTWFNINSYLNKEYTDHEIFEQLERRTIILDEAEEPSVLAAEAHLYWQDIIISGHANEISTEKINEYLNISPENEEKTQKRLLEAQKFSCDALPGGTFISPICLLSAHMMGYFANDKLGIEVIDGTSYIPKNNGGLRSYDLARGSQEEVSICLNLNASDAEILDELKTLLPIYRKLMGIKATSPAYRASDIKKITKYRVLPMLDLKIWATLSNKEIALSVLSKAIYFEDEKGEDNIKKTIYPFMEKVLKPEFMNGWASDLRFTD